MPKVAIVIYKMYHRGQAWHEARFGARDSIVCFSLFPFSGFALDANRPTFRFILLL